MARAGRSLGEGEEEHGTVRAVVDRAPELVVACLPRDLVARQPGVAALAEAFSRGVEERV